MAIGRYSTTFLCCTAAILVVARVGSADDRKWEVDVHGGLVLPTQTGSGVGLLGAPSLPLGAVPTYFFGDGNVLLGRISESFRLAPPSSLDSALQQRFIERSGGSGIGLRVGRALNSRWSLELSWDLGFARTSVSDASKAALDLAGRGFTSTFNALLAFPGRQSSVTSAVTTGEGRGEQVRTTAAVAYHFASRRGLTPYATFGAGATIEPNATATAQLVGSYQFSLPLPTGVPLAPASIHETDTVTIRASQGSAFTTLFGGGVKYARRARWGLRADVRDHVSANRTSTIVSATPTADRSSGLQVVSFFGFPNGTSLQMSTVPNVPSTLSGKLPDTQTFRGTGVRHQIDATVGIYWRF